MKKLLLGALLLVLSTFANAQEVLGVKVDGTRISVVNQLKQKGFIVTNETSNFSVLKGKGLNGLDLEVNVVCSPISKIVWKIVLYLPERNSWYSLKTEYNYYLSSLMKKYGTPLYIFNNFVTPYSEGDGNEMKAVEEDKSNYSAHWDLLKISISEWKQVRIAYENPVNSALDDMENEKINSREL